ncbi:helix-turn-helix transcriptional regulator [Streptomyces sp. NPDC001586]|uniref:helix-turn-helix transcriptional regulator n=1 Tax=Streptomyces sp. NPDC001586 TaxID=3154387 RepID=UPI00332676CB
MSGSRPSGSGWCAGRGGGPRGLRREEVAHLSSVGVTWYTWLEQARDIQVPGQVPDALARALLLDVRERAHLFALAGSPDPAPPALCPSVTPAVRAVPERLGPIPACVRNSRYDILAYNATYGRLFGDMDGLRAQDRNCMWPAFTDPRFRAAAVDLPATLAVMAAKFRAAMAGHLTEPAWNALPARPEGRRQSSGRCGRATRCSGRTPKAKHLRNAHVGLLHVEHTTLRLGPTAGPRLVSYVPPDGESAQRLEQLEALAGARDRVAVEA